MNSYHKNHPDPDVRRKYEEWEAAKGNYDARAVGFRDKEHRDGVKKVEDEKKRAPTMLELLSRIGSNVSFNLSQKKTQVKVNGQKKFKGSGRGRRGS